MKKSILIALALFPMLLPAQVPSSINSFKETKKVDKLTQNYNDMSEKRNEIYSRLLNKMKSIRKLDADIPRSDIDDLNRDEKAMDSIGKEIDKTKEEISQQYLLPMLRAGFQPVYKIIGKGDFKISGKALLNSWDSVVATKDGYWYWSMPLLGNITGIEITKDKDSMKSLVQKVAESPEGVYLEFYPINLRFGYKESWFFNCIGAAGLIVNNVKDSATNDLVYLSQARLSIGGDIQLPKMLKGDFNPHVAVLYKWNWPLTKDEFKKYVSSNYSEVITWVNINIFVPVSEQFAVIADGKIGQSIKPDWSVGFAYYYSIY